MATLLENERTQETLLTKEAELHNAQIKERYRRLAAAEERQFGEDTTQNATDYTVRASVLAPERPVFTSPSFEEVPKVEQTPQVTEFVRERIESPVFTTDKFNGVQEEVVTAQPVQAPVEIPFAGQAPTMAVSVSQETQYSLSRMAKMVMAAFAAVVVMMLTVICINTQIINQKTMQLRNLEEQRAELMEQNAEIQRRIDEARSEETIKEYALSQGMIER